MTMHTSKGLEYPICIVAGLDTKFNKKDISSKLLFDKEIGVGMYAQKSFGYNFSTLNVRAIKDKIAEKSCKRGNAPFVCCHDKGKKYPYLNGGMSRGKISFGFT